MVARSHLRAVVSGPVRWGGPACRSPFDPGHRGGLALGSAVIGAVVRRGTGPTTGDAVRDPMLGKRVS